MIDFQLFSSFEPHYTDRAIDVLPGRDRFRKVNGLRSLLDHKSTGAIACFELRNIDNNVVFTSTTNNPLVPREPVEGENLVSSPALPSQI